MSTMAGEPTWALYGFSALLLKLLREERPDGVALALDRPEPTFRHQTFAGYKAGRPPVPSDLARQCDLLEPLLDALGFPRFSVRGYEADDVLATLADALALTDHDVLVASGDRDMLQLVSERITVLFLGQRGKPAQRYDVEAVVKRFGITPARLPAYVALVGDPSDNIPKVKGIGPVAAQKLIAAHPDIETLLAHTDAIENLRLRTLVRDHEAQLRGSEALARLCRDVPLPDGARYAGLTEAAIAETRAMFEQLEFRSLIPRLDSLTPTAAPARTPAGPDA